MMNLDAHDPRGERRGRSERGRGFGRGQGPMGPGGGMGMGPEGPTDPQGPMGMGGPMGHRNRGRDWQDMGRGFGDGFASDFPGGRRGPGRGRRGDVRNAILSLLNEGSSNGYQLIATISEKTQGLWQPGAGSVYPALGLLADEGLIAQIDSDGKKVYELTDEGRAYVVEHAAELAEPWDVVANPHKGFLDVRGEILQLAMALRQVVMAGKPEQIAQAKSVLDDARKALYRILAE